ncbi:MAG: helix-turn-helix transcriptional regulator [Alphaproteobacteria bacterium]
MTTETQPQKFLDTRTVSHVLGISQSTIKRLRARGDGPAYHTFSSSVRYSVDDLKAYIQRSRSKTG